MKYYFYSIILSVLFCIILLTFAHNCKSNVNMLNITLGAIGSLLVTIFISIIGYYQEKKKIMYGIIANTQAYVELYKFLPLVFLSDMEIIYDENISESLKRDYNKYIEKVAKTEISKVINKINKIKEIINSSENYFQNIQNLVREYENSTPYCICRKTKVNLRSLYKLIQTQREVVKTLLSSYDNLIDDIDCNNINSSDYYRVYLLLQNIQYSYEECTSKEDSKINDKLYLITYKRKFIIEINKLIYEEIYKSYFKAETKDKITAIKESKRKINNKIDSNANYSNFHNMYSPYDDKESYGYSINYDDIPYRINFDGDDSRYAKLSKFMTIPNDLDLKDTGKVEKYITKFNDENVKIMIENDDMFKEIYKLIHQKLQADSINMSKFIHKDDKTLNKSFNPYIKK